MSSSHILYCHSWAILFTCSLSNLSFNFFVYFVLLRSLLFLAHTYMDVGVINSRFTLMYFPFLATEWIGVSKRSWGACISQLFGAVGQCLLAGMIYFIRDWRLAQLITAAPLAVVAIYIWCVCIDSFYITIRRSLKLQIIKVCLCSCFWQVYTRVSQVVVGQRQDRGG